MQYLVSSFAAVAAKRGITLAVSGDDGPEIAAWLDQTKLRHILTNLYSNALKFTPDGGSVTTTISTAERGGRRYADIAVADTGCGIRPEDIGRVFDRFYQTREGDSEVGSGIGLHLAKQYAELHQGTISVASEFGRGSTFTVSLPLDLGGGQDNEAAAASAPGTARADDGTSASSEPQTDRPRVLVVEDNAEFRSFLVRQLSAEYEVIEARDGADGEAKAAGGSPEVIVTDLIMPVMDGLTMCQHLKSNIETSHIPIILLTARNSDEARIEGYNAGADSYISKPFNMELLRARVRALIDKSRAARQSFRGGVDIKPSEVTITSLDEEYVKRAIATVEANIADEEFSAAQLGEALWHEPLTALPQV